MRRALFILGMHRSGTSAAARVASLLGAELGKDLVPPGPDNPAGFWEHAEVVRINDDLLHGLGRTWYEMRGLPEGWIDSSHARSVAMRVDALIESEFSTANLCAIKDPRMCLVAPLWIDAFEKRGFEVDCLFVVRDPAEVTRSMHWRNQWPRASLYLMWVQYLMEATVASERRRRTMITYDRLLSDWRGSMTRVARELQLRWPAAGHGAVSKTIDEFLDPSHRHHAASHEMDGAGEDVPELAASLYRACLGIASGAEKWSALSRRHDAYRAIDQLYASHVGHLLAERWNAEGRAQTAEARLADQPSATAVVRDAMRTLQERVESRLDHMKESLDATSQRVQAMDETVVVGLEAQASATHAVRDSVQQLRDEISALSGETAARFERQRGSVMVVEARIQRQHALLNTLSLRLEQAARCLVTETPVTRDAVPRGEMQSLQSALANSNATVAALLASTSWKLTAPMRWLSVHLLRRPPAPAASAAPAPDLRRNEPPNGVSVHHGATDVDAPTSSAVVGEEPDCRNRPSQARRFIPYGVG